MAVKTEREIILHGSLLSPMSVCVCVCAYSCVYGVHVTGPVVDREGKGVSDSRRIINRRSMSRAAAGVHHTIWHSQLVQCCLSHDMTNFSRMTLMSDVTTAHHKTDSLKPMSHRANCVHQLTYLPPFYWKYDFILPAAAGRWLSYIIACTLPTRQHAYWMLPCCNSIAATAIVYI